MWTCGVARGVGSGVTISRAEILSHAAPFLGRRAEGRPLRTRQIVTTSLTSPDSPVPDEGGGVLPTPLPTPPPTPRVLAFQPSWSRSPLLTLAQPRRSRYHMMQNETLVVRFAPEDTALETSAKLAQIARDSFIP